jgi:GTP cyclohydrolase I
MTTTLPDIQKTPDTRNISIDEVGVCGVQIPLRMMTRDGGTQNTIASVEMAVSLPASVKGTHMSRFTQVMNEALGEDSVLDHAKVFALVKNIALRLDAHRAALTLRFPYFLPRKAPVTDNVGLAPYQAGIEVIFDRHIKESFFHRTSVQVSGQTCCPCSKEISDFDAETGRGQGAHSQRGIISLTVDNLPNSLVWFEELIDVCEKSFSAPSYPILKREDERAATMAAYNNPTFVEDVIRNVEVQLRSEEWKFKISRADVTVRNLETIHFHDAYARNRIELADENL